MARARPHLNGRNPARKGAHPLARGGETALPSLHLPAGLLRDREEMLAREWLEADGRGGFASGTVAGPLSRRYHALLCVDHDGQRKVVVNALEEALVGAGGAAHELSTQMYEGADGPVVHPRGFERCTGFKLDPWPMWRYAAGGTEVAREIAVVRPAGAEPATVVRWRVRDGRFTLRVRPLCSGRDYHALHGANPDLDPGLAPIGHDAVRFTPYQGVPPVSFRHNGTLRVSPDWYRRFHHAEEAARGLPATEDLFSPSEIIYEIGPGQDAWLVISVGGPPTEDPAVLLAAERERRAAVLATAGQDGAAAGRAWLTLAADQLLVTRGPRSTVIAGYPWFTDWGRDTFISLEGLCLGTGRADVARRILADFVPHVSAGMIPNRFPDSGDAPEYNAIDASLWYCLAACRYAAATGDAAFVRSALWPALRSIVDGYRAGTRFGIRVDDDGLVGGGAPGVALTWMDARVDGWVVTPRRGKPVEIQALWIAALEAMSGLARADGAAAEAGELAGHAARAREAFAARFWSPAQGHLRDVVDGPDGDDDTLRPNQLYALGLVDGLLSAERAAAALDAVDRALLTPYGLRTRAPQTDGYRGVYEGDQHARDAAYHQGTVWPFLLGIYSDACLRVRGARPDLGEALLRELATAGLGTVSEIYDGDPPHRPRGCFAQAWSVAELLRVSGRESETHRRRSNAS